MVYPATKGRVIVLLEVLRDALLVGGDTLVIALVHDRRRRPCRLCTSTKLIARDGLVVTLATTASSLFSSSSWGLGCRSLLRRRRCPPTNVSPPGGDTRRSVASTLRLALTHDPEVQSSLITRRSDNSPLENSSTPNQGFPAYAVINRPFLASTDSSLSSFSGPMILLRFSLIFPQRRSLVQLTRKFERFKTLYPFDFSIFFSSEADEFRIDFVPFSFCNKIITDYYISGEERSNVRFSSMSNFESRKSFENIR